MEVLSRSPSLQSFTGGATISLTGGAFGSPKADCRPVSAIGGHRLPPSPLYAAPLSTLGVTTAGGSCAGNLDRALAGCSGLVRSSWDCPPVAPGADTGVGAVAPGADTGGVGTIYTWIGQTSRFFSSVQFVHSQPSILPGKNQQQQKQYTSSRMHTVIHTQYVSDRPNSVLLSSES